MSPGEMSPGETDRTAPSGGAVDQESSHTAMSPGERLSAAQMSPGELSPEEMSPGEAIPAEAPPKPDRRPEATTERTEMARADPGASGQRVSLAEPDAQLMQETSRGPLPIIGPDGRKPWQVYARPVPPADGRPRLAVVVSELGLSRDATARAIRLPGPVTLSFTPYASSLPQDVARARGAGHEVLLDLPMEPISYPADDPGPHTLLTSLNPTDNLARLEWLLGRFTGYVGVINHMGSRFTAAPDSLRPVLDALNARGLMFVDSRSTSKSAAATLASQIGLPRAINDRFIDHDPSRSAIDQAMADIESMARSNGWAVAVARPFPVTLARLAAWIPALEQRGIEVVPVSALADKQGDR